MIAPARPFSPAEMVLLADLVLDEGIAKNEDVDLAATVAGTGYSVDQFRAICDARWNGPAWVR